MNGGARSKHFTAAEFNHCLRIAKRKEATRQNPSALNCSKRDNLGKDWLQKWGLPESSLKLLRVRGAVFQHVQCKTHACTLQKVHKLEYPLIQRPQPCFVYSSAGCANSWPSLRNDHTASSTDAHIPQPPYAEMSLWPTMTQAYHTTRTAAKTVG